MSPGQITLALTIAFALIGLALIWSRLSLAWRLWRDPGLRYPLHRAWQRAGQQLWNFPPSNRP